MAKPKTAEPRALAVALESESLQALFSAWLELRLQRAGALTELAREREQLHQRAQLMLKAVEVAREMPETSAPPKKPRRSRSLAHADPLAQFHAQAEAELARARKELVARGARQEREFAKLDARVRKALLARADQHLAIHKPRLELKLHPLGKDQALLELAAIGDEDAVLLSRLLAGKLPTRWGFYSDDAVDDLSRGPARLYPDEGNAELWPSDADAEDAVLFGASEFVPSRMQVAFAIPGRRFPRFKLVHHGLTGQVEARREGEPYSHLLRREDGELLAGYLLRLRVSGRLDLQLEVS